MITRNSDGSYSAFHPGALRPIVVDGDSWTRVLLILAEALHEQEAEEQYIALLESRIINLELQMKNFQYEQEQRLTHQSLMREKEK